MRDYVEFTYIFSDSKIFLINIDISNIFNNYTYFMRKYNINILFVYLLVYFVRENDLLNLKTLYLYFLTNKSITILNELIPFELKKKMQIEYGYNDVIFELKKRILTNNEENKYQLISILNEAIDSLPNIEYSNYPFLDNKENNYSFLKKYDKFNDAPQNFQNVLNESLKILGGQVRWHVPTSLHNVDPSIMFNTVISSTIINLYNPCTMSASGSAGILKMEKKIILQFSKLIKWEVNNSGGIFTYGGKFCLIYAIKCGLNRIKNFDFNGNNPVIITSVINHYSIESVCNILGLKDTSVIRIPINKHGTIDFNLFEMELVKCIKNNTPIACVIFSGGNTTHCSIENIKTGKFIIYETFKNYNIQYRPFIYFDTVVCWPWLFFQDYNFKENHLSLPKETIDDIKKISSLICEANYADGIGIDFHKLGFCPLNNSLFITKNKLDLYSFAGKDNLTIKEPYQYSIDNSRGGAAIISAWNVLQSVGADGFRAYIANMLEIKNVFKTELKSNDFIIIDEKNTHGFALIFLCFSPLINKKDLKLYSLNDTQLIENNHYLYELSEHLKKNKKFSCNLRFLPNYIKNNSGRENLSVLSILPMTLNIDKNIAQIIGQFIIKEKKNFDKNLLHICLNLSKNIPTEEPK